MKFHRSVLRASLTTSIRYCDKNVSAQRLSCRDTHYLNIRHAGCS